MISIQLNQFDSQIDEIESEPTKKFSFTNFFFTKPTFSPRTVRFDGKGATNFPKNIIRNQKYTLLTFFPYTLYQQFKYFINFVHLFPSFFLPFQIIHHNLPLYKVLFGDLTESI